MKHSTQQIDPISHIAKCFSLTRRVVYEKTIPMIENTGTNKMTHINTDEKE